MSAGRRSRRARCLGAAAGSVGSRPGRSIGRRPSPGSRGSSRASRPGSTSALSSMVEAYVTGRRRKGSRLARLRGALRQAGLPSPGVLLVGLTGGIGSGKSTVSALPRRAGRGGDRRRRHHPRAPGARARRCSRPWSSGSARRSSPPTAPSTARRSPTSCSPTPTPSKDLGAIVHPAVGAEIAAPPRGEAGHGPRGDPRRAAAGRVRPRRHGRPGRGRRRPEVAVARLVEQRGMREDDARARMASQARREERLARADVVIDNSGTRRRPRAARRRAVAAPRRAGPSTGVGAASGRSTASAPGRSTQADALAAVRGDVGAGGASGTSSATRSRRPRWPQALARRRRRRWCCSAPVRPAAAGPPRRRRPRHRVGGGARSSATTGCWPGFVDLAILVAVARRGAPRDACDDRDRPRRPAVPRRPPVPARLLRLRRLRQAQLGVLRPVGELRRLLLPRVDRLRRARAACSSTARPGSSGR